MTQPVAQIFLRVAEAAEALAISRSKTYEEIATGRLRSVTIGRSRRIPVEAIAEYVERLMVKSDPTQ